ncbi:MAG TPA: EscU/YscU/HrcU family type III secretion system export apparatus switch protein [Polyangiaceae bacterium]|jgi:type III secretion protein U|nr:EscU/YscU/HrcU family type III secretion system export apparatus switch protein [Polyangiaceae bacterium]
MAEKTEQPSARQLRKARAQGDVPVSGALSQAVVFIAALALAPSALSATFALVGESLRTTLAGRALSAEESVLLLLRLSLPVVAVGVLAATALSAAQTGGLFALERLVPKLDRLNPLSGLASLVSGPRLIGLLRALLASGVLLVLSWLVLRASLPALLGSVANLPAAVAAAAVASRRLANYAAMVGLALALLDLLVVRRAWLKRWMMTRDEVRRESRESEGDPEVKAARRRAHQEMLTSAAIHAVKDASVVIVNPTHLAVALRYRNEEDAAPNILAQGQGDLARRIVEAAHAYGVPVVRDVPIARALSELEVGDEIPEALYEAVAEILREVWAAEQRDA